MDVLISMLEHYVYCPRQCALIHLEQTYDENVYTIRGSHLHEHVDEETSTVEGGIRIEKSLPIWSERLGIRGKADVVEFHGDTPYPIEYKLGKRKWRNAADVQLCAQAICLEDMLHTDVPAGAIFHKGSQRRREVQFTVELREQTEKVVMQVRELLESNVMPTAVNDNRCPNCSLIDACVPQLSEKDRVKGEIQGLYKLDDK